MEDPIVLLIVALLSFVVWAFWYAIGKYMENRHLASLAEREQALAGMFCTNLRRPADINPCKVPSLVAGETVVASDNFKTFLFTFRKIFGGESKTFTRLYDRARREATLRMLADAQRLGFNAVCNVRYEATDIGGNTMNAGKQQKPMAVCMAVGTAYIRA
jgi:uncharacterized protein YbjQ (UPF0145 family)